jgi:hypothetical protein
MVAAMQEVETRTERFVSRGISIEMLLTLYDQLISAVWELIALVFRAVGDLALGLHKLAKLD